MIQSIQLSNWKKHGEGALEFKPGTNVLVGSMGAGKSSILQGISFALFGTFTELKRRDLKIAEIVKRGAAPPVAEISVTLRAPNGKSYIVRRKIDNNKTLNEATIRDSEGGLLAGPNPTAVNDYIKDLLGIDDDVFLRTVYAMQNETDLILKLPPGERKKKIDELMGLDRFEIARKNCVSLTNKISAKKQGKEEAIAHIDLSQVDMALGQLKAELSDLEKGQKKRVLDLEKSKKELTEKRSKLEKLREKHREVEKMTERNKMLEQQISELRERLKGKKLDKSRSDLEREEEELKLRMQDMQVKRREISESLSLEREKIRQTEREIGVLESKTSELKSKLESLKSIRTEFNELKMTHGFVDINSELTKVKTELSEKQELNQANQAEMNSHRKHLQDLEMTSSVCPVCNSGLTEMTREELISKKKKQIAQLLYDNNHVVEEVSKLRERQEELEGIFDKHRSHLQELEKEEEFIAELNTMRQEYDKKIDVRNQLESNLKSKEEKLVTLEKDLEDLNLKLSILREDRYLYTAKDQMETLLNEINEIKTSLGKETIDAKQVEKEEFLVESTLKKIQELETKTESTEDLLNEKRQRFLETQNKKESALRLKSEVKRLEEKMDFMKKFRNALQATQLALRDELILAVNEVMSAVWMEIYPYEAWSGVRLAISENDYSLQLKQSDGDWVSVAGFASGGERMLASLAVRIAFARVLAPNLSLLILDEPTHNLDEKAVQTLIEVLQSRVTDYLDQIFVITHDEKLAESADNIIRIK